MKKLKQKSFAASVDRDEVRLGTEMFGVALEEHISYIIQVLQQHQQELELQPQPDTQA
jgi:predicted hydrolase (HD superfamily)